MGRLPQCTIKREMYCGFSIYIYIQCYFLWWFRAESLDISGNKVDHLLYRGGIFLLPYCTIP